tara:strand:+ start:2479 stop:4260 length:1782 start_codon:yes stop_codon:yes gene_type:complete
LELLDYPLDSYKILRKKRSLKSKLLVNDSFITKRIAILGGTSTGEIKEQLEIFLLNSNIRPDFYECEYGQFYETVMFEDESLKNFNPEIIYIHISNENLKSLNDVNQISEDRAKVEFIKLELIWQKLSQSFECEIIQDNFEPPSFKNLGNFDVSSKSSITRTVNILNEMLYKQAIEKNYLHICDRNYLSSKLGLTNWKDYSLWLSARYSLSYKAITNICHTLNKIIQSISGFSKKCLVLDLDNTLWGGVIGDDGVDGILLGKESAIGEAFLDFHSYIKELKNRGVILAVCSKNDFDNARSGFDHPDSILKFSDFTVFKANWELKTKNIYDIAQEINIGLDSMVFIDDNPVERDIVRKEFSGVVSVPDIGDDITRYREILDGSELFNMTSLSEEDKKRNDFYKNDKKREKAAFNFTDYNDYLKSLKMIAEIGRFNTTYLTRITQLTNKTNQFNLTTKRMTEKDIESIMNDDMSISLYAKLDDKFGENGLVSVIQGNIKGSSVSIDLWLMSCRVFKRTLEYTIFYEFAKLARSKNINTIIGKYIPTKKNKIVSDIYKELGFSMVDENNGNLTYELNLSEYDIPKNKNITLKKDQK